MRLLGILRTTFFFYYDGLRGMTIFGKKLWGLVVAKAIILIVLAFFLMPNVLRQFKTQEQKANHVANQMLGNNK